MFYYSADVVCDDLKGISVPTGHVSFSAPHTYVTVKGRVFVVPEERGGTGSAVAGGLEQHSHRFS